MLKLSRLCFSLLLFPAAIAACSSPQSTPAADSTSDLRSISTSEALSELTAVGDAIRAYYGPLEFKEQRFGFNLDAALAEAAVEIKAGHTEGDLVRPIYELLAKLHDGHVSYQYPLPGSATAQYGLQLLIAPYEAQYVVDAIAPGTPIERGDIVESVDGILVQDLAERLAPLVGSGNADSEQIFIAAMMTNRPFYIPNALIPRGANAHIVVTKADGSRAETDLPWITKPGGLKPPPPPAPPAPTPAPASASVLAPDAMLSTRSNELRMQKAEISASLLAFGSLTPFWMSVAVHDALNIHAVAPKPETLAAVGTPATFPLHLSAFKYAYEGKTILMVRIPSFVVTAGAPGEDVMGENVAWLAALLQENMAAPVAGAAPEDAPADVVVLDDTENPGGAANYALGLASLFATAPIPSLVQADHADRRWIAAFNKELTQVAPYPEYAAAVGPRLHTIEAAYDANATLTDFIPLSGASLGPGLVPSVDAVVGGTTLAPYPTVQWSKPVLILHDRLSGSCGDFFPAILQNGGVAKTFGTPTMGLGGSVEPVLTQVFSGAVLSLTRGMGGPFNPNGAPKLIENAGVTPNFPYAVTIADRRNGFVGYANAFSHIAATLTR